MDAVLELKHYSTERLLDLWEMTTTNSDHNIPAVRGWLMDEIEKRVEIIEKWGKKNPIVTRQMKFLEMFPRAEITDGALSFCPNSFDPGYREEKSCRNISCGECREEYWSEEVE